MGHLMIKPCHNMDLHSWIPDRNSCTADGFEFAGEFEEGIRQIGNRVPPLFIRAIARWVRTGHIRMSFHPVPQTVCG
jgi:hypothetical protein